MNHDNLTLDVDFVEPGYEAFIHSPVLNNINWCWWCGIFSIQYKIESFITKKFNEWKEQKRLEIEKRNAIRSYKRSFIKFNNEPTYNEFHGEDVDDRVRGNIHVKTKRNFIKK